MKRHLLRFLSLALMLLLACSALAEAFPDVESDLVEAPVEEVESELECVLPEEPAYEEGEFGVLAAEDTAEGEPAPETPAADETPSDAPQEEAPAEEYAPGYGPALTAQTIKLSKDASRTVYLGIPYAIALKDGEIKRVKSSASEIATASKSGEVQLLSTGTAKLTVTSDAGDKLVLTLKVADKPAPQDMKLSAKKGAFKLKWSEADFATGYLIQYSTDGKHWKDHTSLAAEKLSLNVTSLVRGATWFRAVAILGDTLGGASDVVSALGPVSDVKVICEESRYYGPSDRLNVTWTASPGATGYAVYRASLPSGKYKKLGTTTKTWYPDTRSATKLYAYRIKPLCGELDLPMSDPVTLWSGMDSNVLPPKDMTSKSGIILLVNKKAQVVTAYIKDENGRYSLPLRHMICSTGRTYERTRNGTYTLDHRKGEWYTYPGPSGDTIRWPSVYRSGYYFHSPLYNRNHTIRGGTVSRLGKRASAGCIRLKSNDAEWVYKNCVNGTTVYICDGKAINSLNKALKPKDVSVKGF